MRHVIPALPPKRSLMVKSYCLVVLGTSKLQPAGNHTPDRCLSNVLSAQDIASGLGVHLSPAHETMVGHLGRPHALCHDANAAGRTRPTAFNSPLISSATLNCKRKVQRYDGRKCVVTGAVGAGKLAS
jgi:hypothetical protein